MLVISPGGRASDTIGLRREVDINRIASRRRRNAVLMIGTRRRIYAAVAFSSQIDINRVLSAGRRKSVLMIGPRRIGRHALYLAVTHVDLACRWAKPLATTSPRADIDRHDLRERVNQDLNIARQVNHVGQSTPEQAILHDVEPGLFLLLSERPGPFEIM
jgi:hypothetical protein